jgi:hypothetical protein
MKTMKILILFLVLTFRAYCPEYRTLYVAEAEKIQPFDPMLYSFQKIESNFNIDVVNSLGYTGILQEGQKMIDEANRICKMVGNPLRFSFPPSALDSLQSVQVWYIVQSYWNPQYNLRKAAKIWNPEASINYYNKIRKVYEEAKRNKRG